jgi:AcrR family transcriptional regulator
MGKRTARQSPGLRQAGVQRTRRDIIAAARQHLVEAGYHRLSLEDVASDAGVTRVTIYRQFTSKLGLLDAVADDLAARAQVVARMQQAASVAEAPAAFRGMVFELCRFWSVDPDLFRRLISLAAVDPQVREVIDARESWRHQQVTAFVRRLADEDRLLPPFDEDRASATVAAATSFPTCDEMARRLDRGIDQLDELITALLAAVARLD